MNVENFKITPRVVAADSVVEITVAGRFPHNDLRVFGPDLTLDAVGIEIPVASTLPTEEELDAIMEE